MKVDYLIRSVISLCLFAPLSCVVPEEEGTVATEPEEKKTVAVVSDEERWLAEICSPKYKGRFAGTKECDMVVDYISQELEKMGYEVVFQNFKLKDSLDLRNIIVRRKGDSDSLIVIGAHYDGAVYGEDYPAADDNGSGVVSVLSLSKALSDSRIKLKKTVLLAFWAAEEVTLNSVFDGSRYFVNHFEEKQMIQNYCNMDCFAYKDQGMYFYYSPKNERVGRLMNSILTSYTDDNVEVIVKENEKKNSDYVSFSQAGIPYFGWNDYDVSGRIHSYRDSIGSISIDKIKKAVSCTLDLIVML